MAAFVHNITSGGRIWMNKSAQEMFSAAYAELESRLLSDIERASLDAFGAIWFIGWNFKPSDPVYKNFLALTGKFGIELLYMERRGQTGAAVSTPWCTPHHVDAKDQGSEWPKKKTKEIAEAGLTLVDWRARYRCEARDAKRADIAMKAPERAELASMRIQITNLQTQLQEVRVDAERRETELVKSVDSILNEMRGEIDSLKVERTLQYRGAILHRMFEPSVPADEHLNSALDLEFENNANQFQRCGAFQSTA